MAGSSSPSPCRWDPNHQKDQRNSVSGEYGDHGPTSSVCVSEDNSDYKKKAVVYDDYQKQVKDGSSEGLTGSSADNLLESDAVEEGQNSAELYDADSGSESYDDYYEDEDEDYVIYDDDDINDDFSYSLAAEFDDLDIPPGVEATVPLLQKAAPEKPKSDIEGDIGIKYNAFKKFDTVGDYSDHYYAKQNNDTRKPTKEWSKKIQQDWKILENDLPDMIFVRVYEERMDLLRAAIVGPAGTPYQDGLFFFDFRFPREYPFAPPNAHYHSGGLKLNPNLYRCGKVCLSLLGTWSGEGCEKWDPHKSTMIQVLVSIQAFILNERPFFNEPVFGASANTDNGQRNALAYNEIAFVNSCKTMLYSLRMPPKYFEDLVAGHFRKRGHAILVACRAYLDSTLDDNDSTTIEINAQGRSCKIFVQDLKEDLKDQLRQLFEDLLMEFTVKGADCKEFLNQKVRVGDASALPVRR